MHIRYFSFNKRYDFRPIMFPPEVWGQMDPRLSPASPRGRIIVHSAGRREGWDGCRRAKRVGRIS